MLSTSAVATVMTTGAQYSPIHFVRRGLADIGSKRDDPAVAYNAPSIKSMKAKIRSGRADDITSYEGDQYDV